MKRFINTVLNHPVMEKGPGMESLVCSEAKKAS